MKYVAFDLGASSGKMMLAELNDQKLSFQLLHRFPNRQVLLNGGLYWDIISIFQNLKQGLNQAMELTSEPLCLGIDSFCNDFGLIDHDGHLISQVRCYRDERTKRREQDIYQKISPEELYRRTGSQTALFNTSMQMAAMMMDSDAALLESCHKALLIPDLLTYFLSGEKHTEYTLASVTQLLDYQTEAWATDVMKRLQIRPDIFPNLLATESYAGGVSKILNPDLHDRSIQIRAVAGHDTAAAVAALPTAKDHVAFISSGTWSLMGTEVAKPIITEQTFKHNIAYEGGIEHRYRMNKNVMGLWIVQECCADYELKTRESCTYEFMNRITNEAQPFLCLIDPDDPAFYMPGNMIEKIRSYCLHTKQVVPDDLGQILRCVFESLALKYRYVLDIFEEVLGYSLNEIFILGGGGQNLLLNQFVANACDRPVFAGPAEAALAGNIMMQMKGTGDIPDLENGRSIIKNSFPIQSFEPTLTKDWNEQYHFFKHLISE